MTGISSTLGDLLQGAVIIGPARVMATSPLRVDIIPGSVVNGVGRNNIRPGDVVVVARTSAGTPMIVGVITPRPTQGTVLSVGQEVGKEHALVQFPTGLRANLEWILKPAVGQRVSVYWTPEGGVILGACSSPSATSGLDSTLVPPVAPAPLPPPPPTPMMWAPTQVRSAQGGGWSESTEHSIAAWQGSYNNQPTYSGYYFYGAGMRVPGAQATGGTITLTRSPILLPGSPDSISAAIRWHADANPGVSPPSFLATPGISTLPYQPGETKTIPLPQTVAQGILDGQILGWGLAATDSASYGAFTGPIQSPSSGLLTISYTQPA